jgi:hypothetical protein
VLLVQGQHSKLNADVSRLGMGSCYDVLVMCDVLVMYSGLGFRV